MRHAKPLALVLLAVPMLALTGATGATGANDDLHADVVQTVKTFKQKDPGISKFFGNAAGYAVFPSVAKGAIGVGAAHGDGELLIGGKAVGETSLTQVTIGLQLGGQEYSEIIFFENKETLAGFQKGDFTFAAQVSAVALTSGASANAAYKNGVAVFTVAKGGLMYEASVGGQKFSYKKY